MTLYWLMAAAWLILEFAHGGGRDEGWRSGDLRRRPGQDPNDTPRWRLP